MIIERIMFKFPGNTKDDLNVREERTKLEYGHEIVERNERR